MEQVRSRAVTAVMFITLAVLGMPPTALSANSCIGDCDQDGEVAMDDLATLVNIALGNAKVQVCAAGNANQDQRITVDEILAATNAGAGDCAAAPTRSPTPIPPTPSSAAYAMVSVLRFKISVDAVGAPIPPASANWEYRLIDPDGSVASRCRGQNLGPEIARSDPEHFLTVSPSLGGCNFLAEFVVASTPQPQLLDDDRVYNYFANRPVQPKPGMWKLALESLPSNPGTGYVGTDVRACVGVGLFDQDFSGPSVYPECQLPTNSVRVDVGAGPVVVAAAVLQHQFDDGYVADQEPNDTVESAKRIWKNFAFPAGFPVSAATPSSDFFVFTADRSTGYLFDLSPANGSSQAANLDLYLYDAGGQLLGSSAQLGAHEELVQRLTKGESAFVEVRALDLPTADSMDRQVGYTFYGLYVTEHSGSVQ